MATTSVVLTSTLKIQPKLQRVFGAALSSTLRMRTGTLAQTGRVAVVQEVLIVSVTPRPKWSTVLVLVEKLKLHHAFSTGGISRLALGSILRLAGRINTGVSAKLSAMVHFRQTQKLNQATALKSTIRLLARQELMLRYQQGLRERLELVDKTPTFGIGAYLRSRLALRSSLARTYRAVSHLVEELGLTGVLHPQLMVVVLATDEVELSGETLLKMIYDGQLSDYVDFVIDIVDPSGDVTTWAMNARTGAVTEYLNFNFNSFAQSHAGTYLGAGDSGLYELVGENDNGSAVVADMIGGLMDLSGGFLTGIKAAYLAVRGEGQFYLKLTSGQGQSYVYGVTADNLRTSRINMGKGLRALYWTWELISTGQDFDLQGLTFLPLQFTRRL